MSAENFREPLTAFRNARRTGRDSPFPRSVTLPMENPSKMKTPFYSCLIATLCLGASANAAATYLTTSDGRVWRYASAADMYSQTNTTTSGIEVASHAGYATDLGSTMDFSTGRVYRITGGGDVVEYSGLAGFLANTGGATIAIGIYTGTEAVNGFSYDGNTGGFYGTLPGGQGSRSGDIRSWASIADVVANTGSETAAGYGGNLFNLYDPDTTTLTAVNSLGTYTAGDQFSGQYYQAAGNGNLEGWESLALYAASPNNRGTVSGVDSPNVFGGSTTAWGVNVDAVAAFAVPEPSIALLGGLGLLGFLRRRR